MPAAAGTSAGLILLRAGHRLSQPLQWRARMRSSRHETYDSNINDATAAVIADLLIKRSLCYVKSRCLVNVTCLQYT